MKLVQIDIIDFKWIKKETLKIKSNQLCVVGKNESGKSSLINAISFLNIYDYELSKNLLNKSSENYPNGSPIIIGVFEVNPKTYSKLIKILSEYFSGDDFNKLPKTSDSSIIQLKRWGNGFSNFSLNLLEKEKYHLNLSNPIKEKASFYEIFFNDIYPTINYYENEELLIEPANIEELNSDDKRFETFRRLFILGDCDDFSLLDNEEIGFTTTYLADINQKLNVILNKHYKQDDSISITIVPARDNKYHLLIRDSSNKSFTINERSPWFQYYFSFLINKLYLNKINSNKNNIIILDEPGNGLHPKGAKDLLKTFDDISKNAQIIYTTHNPFLAVRNCIDSLVFVYKSAEEGTKVDSKPFLNKYQVLRKELGILLNDSFLIGDMNLIVEGNTEKLSFHRLFQFEKYQDLQWMNIYNADGVANIPQAINYLGKNNLKLSGIVFLDSDNEASKIKVNKFYNINISEGNWIELEVNSALKDKSTRTFEDLFPQDLYVKAYNDYCRNLEHLETFEISYVDYEYNEPIDTPIIDVLSNHYKTFLSHNSTSTITKQDVARYFFDSIEELSINEQKVHLKNLFLVCDKILENFNKLNKDVKY